MILAWIFVIISCCVLSLHSTIPHSEWLALRDFYSATNGPDWKCCTNNTIAWNFTNTSANPCLDNWLGVSCTYPAPYDFYYVFELHLPNKDLIGTLPSSISHLEHLGIFRVGGNGLYDVIPSSFGQIEGLGSLQMDDNFFSGTLPSTLGNISSLFGFSVSANYIDGTLPQSLGNLSGLVTFLTSYNSLTGSIPESFGGFPRMGMFFVTDNSLEGSLPESFGNNTAIFECQLAYNYFSNTLPSSLARLTDLTDIYLEHNRFTGTIPSVFGDLGQISFFSINSNHCNGSVPSTFDKLTSLKTVDLAYNSLSGSLPSSMSNMTAMISLDAGFNRLSGQFPSWFGVLTQMEYINLRHNRLTGTIPNSIGLLSVLVEFIAADNCLSGSLPTSIGSFDKLKVLFLQSNSFTGPLPGFWQNMSRLAEVDISNNLLTGSIPPANFNSTSSSLYMISLYTNCLSGTIPSTFKDLSSLQYLILANNKFSGTIPHFLFNSMDITYFYGEQNKFTGPLPSSLSSASKLQYLDVGYNYFDGSLPSMAKCVSLVEVFLSDNQLTGSLDNFLAPLQIFVENVQVNSNQLTGTLPEEIFQLPLLNTFVAVSNCFHGTLPSTVCNSSNMNSLILDGLSSATSCRNALFPGLSSVYTLSSKSVNGPIPSCVFNLTNINTLHISGNGFTGSLPDDLVLSPTLTNLALSHNQIAGDINKNIQERVWYSLDLSYNRITGTLLSTFSSITTSENYSNSTLTVDIENNRLSGKIPGTIVTMKNVSSLGTNLFSCSINGNDLPNHDTGRSNYECGSTLFGFTYLGWVFLLLCAVCSGGVLWLFRETLKDRFEVDLMLEQVYVWLRVTDHTAPNVHHTFAAVGHILSIACRAVLYGIIFIGLILLPFYDVMSVFFGTYTHMYAYTVSAAFLSGWVPSIGEFVCWMVLLSLLVGYVTPRIQQHKELCSTHHRADYHPIALHHTICIVLMNIFVNLAIVGGVNLGFVYVIIHENSSLYFLAQGLLAIFKFVWNQMAMFFVLKYSGLAVLSSEAEKSKLESRFLKMQIVMAMVNNIVIPLVVVASINKSCLYNAFVEAPSITSSFTNTLCLVSSPYVACGYSAEYTTTTSFIPPFVYSYQCSSSFVTYYAPTFIILCVITSFVVPLGKVLLLHLHKRAAVGTRWYCLLDAILPQLLRPLPTVNTNNDHNKEVSASSDGIDNRSDKDGVIFNGNRILVAISTNMGLLLTFGVVFPPLGVAFALSIWCIVYSRKIELGRFVTHARVQKHTRGIDIITAECEFFQQSSLFVHIVWMLVTVSCIFYTLFLFDTLGNEVGLEGSYFVLILVPLMPLVLYLLANAGGLLAGVHAATPDGAVVDSTGDSKVLSGPRVGTRISSVELRLTSTFNPMDPSSRDVSSSK